MGEILKDDNNIEATNPLEPKESGIRHLLVQLVKRRPQIVSISDYDEAGDMRFIVNLADLGVSVEDYYKYNKDFLSNFMVDFIGELLIRENIDLFLPKLISAHMDKNAYISAVSKSIHRRFGMKLEKGVMTFSFHISLIQEILTEDFKLK